MNNIVEFIRENYIWIMVVILLSIITVIGFLADKKKNPKQKVEKNVDNNPIPGPNMDQMNYQTQNQNNMMGVMPNINNINNVIQPNQNMNTEINTIPQPVNPQPMSNPTGFVEPMSSELRNVPLSSLIDNSMNNIEPINNNVNNPQLVDNINVVNSINQEPIYQPLGEQNLNLAPKEINIPIEPMRDNTMMMNNQMPVENNMYSQNMVNPQPQMMAQPQNNNMVYNQMPQNNTLNNMNQMNYQENPVVNSQPIIPNTNANQTIPNQQPVNPQPIPNAQYLNPQITPINFIYGPQSNNNNNNQNMQQ